VDTPASSGTSILPVPSISFCSSVILNTNWSWIISFECHEPRTTDFHDVSSREIAYLCEKQHKNVLRDIEQMLQDINHLRFGAVDFEKKYQDAKGEWRKEYRLPKDLTVTLITGYGFVSPLVLGSDQFFQPINKGTGFRSKLHESTIQGN
jgi:hypothetical protein